MQGALTIKRIGGSVLAAAALAAAAAGPAEAMIGPACSTRLAQPATGPAPSCSFGSPTDWATIAVVPNGTVTATIRCYTSYGYTITTSRTVSKPTYWATWTPDNCSLTLTSADPLAVANASATPTIGPIIGPDPA